MSGAKSVLVIGAGSIGERHLRCFAATGLVKVSVCEPNESQRNKISERYPTTECFQRLGGSVGKPTGRRRHLHSCALAYSDCHVRSQSGCALAHRETAERESARRF